MAHEKNCNCEQKFTVRKDHKMMGYKCSNCGKVEPFKETKQKKVKEPVEEPMETLSENLENKEV